MNHSMEDRLYTNKSYEDNIYSGNASLNRYNPNKRCANVFNHRLIGVHDENFVGQKKKN